MKKKILLKKLFQTMTKKFSSFWLKDWKRFGVYETVWKQDEIIPEEEWKEIEKLLDELEELDKLEKLDKLSKRK